ncbi:MAG: hypothetical protein ACKO4Q_10935 [Planctomycetota bacterium]
MGASAEWKLVYRLADDFESPRAGQLRRREVAVALLMTAVDNGRTKLGTDNWVQELVTGAILVIAVALDRWLGSFAVYLATGRGLEP